MKEMIALQSFRYADRKLKPGMEFRASKREASLLKHLKKARYLPPRNPQPEEVEDETTRMELESEDYQADEVRPQKPKRRYRRRDMKAEDDA